MESLARAGLVRRTNAVATREIIKRFSTLGDRVLAYLVVVVMQRLQEACRGSSAAFCSGVLTPTGIEAVASGGVLIDRQSRTDAMSVCGLMRMRQKDVET